MIRRLIALCLLVAATASAQTALDLKVLRNDQIPAWWYLTSQGPGQNPVWSPVALGASYDELSTMTGLAANTIDGAIRYCTDCNVGSPCTDGEPVDGGAMAFLINNTWVCPFGGTTTTSTTSTTTTSSTTTTL